MPPLTTIQIDYRGVIGKLWEAIPAAEFITLAASAKFLGDRRLQTQHFIGGAAKWVRTGDDAITGYHQMRVAHQRYKDDERKEVLCKGHCHGKATVRYRKVEEGGVWKLAGMEPDIRWTEGEFDKVFPH
ncbi:Scytalone dehydratase [Chaetomium strumarium]|uniref:Scytalone dehydratase n=1 Tax=Chaetomium strumarium TaxID=1170767 RepID=A0AAJ0GKS5_9PEZI|nr:Scytalone dehydratase [Chaetomium strumarium]